MMGYRTPSFNRAYIPAHKGTWFYARSISYYKNLVYLREGIGNLTSYQYPHFLLAT